MQEDPDARDHVDRALIRRYHASGDPELRDRAVLRTRPLAYHLAQRYAGRGEPLGDLRQVAVLGLVQAVERYDPTSRTRFASFATPTITGTLRRHFRDSAWRVHVPRRLQELSLRRREAQREIEAREGRAATRAELAEALGVDDETLSEIDGLATAHAPDSLDLGPSDPRAPARPGSEDPGFERVEDRAALRHAIAILDERDRDIIRMRYAEDRNQRDIGDAIGVSQVQVSRLLRRSVDRMRAVAGDG